MHQPSVVEAQAPEVRLVGRLATELEEVGAWLQPHFRRREAHTAALAYVKALLGRTQRKNAWGLSEDAGHRAPYAFQHLLERAKWDADAVRDDVLEYARRALGEGAILGWDETGFLKRGEKSVGLARQYTGTAGKVENAQVGVFLSYVTPRGHALVDREPYLPEAWTQDAARRRAGGIPDDVSFESKPALAQGMLQRALAAGLKPAWVVGDEVYGRDTTLRRFLEDLHQPYVLTVASNTHVWRGFYQVKPGDMVKQVPPQAWVRLSAGADTKGPRLYDWARMRSTDTWACRGGCFSAAASRMGRWPSTWPTPEATPRWRPWYGWRAVGGRWRRTSSPPRARWAWRTTRYAPGRPGTGT